MKLDRTILRSRVAQRIATLFIICALVPIAVLAIISYFQVSSQLRDQAKRSLRQSTKSRGMAVLERLELLEEKLKLIATVRPEAQSAEATTSQAVVKGRFTGLAIENAKGERVRLFGEVPVLPVFTPDELKHAENGGTVLTTQVEPGAPARVFLRRFVRPDSPAQPVLVAELDPEFLWAFEDGQADVWVLDQGKNLLYEPRKTDPAFLDALRSPARHELAGEFTWKEGSQTMLGSHWAVFLKASFGAERWTVVTGQSQDDVLQPMVEFQKSFPLVILVALWFVMLLTLIQIRRSMTPLEKLCAATERIAQRDFQSRVVLDSRDEFQKLAESFNSMTDRLGRQFHALATANEIDRGILSALDRGRIVETVLLRVPQLLPCDAVGVTLCSADSAPKALTYTRGGPLQALNVKETPLEPAARMKIYEHSELLEFRRDASPPEYLAALGNPSLQHFLVAPFFVKGRLAGMISLGYLAPPALTEEDRERARQIADQVAVAVANAGLIEELKELNWGMLTALARAIDAKSPWTSGHSDRVTKMALTIAGELGLDQDELEVLHRGGLLHDIGKIGVPATILDKPGKLTREEFRIMQEHVRLGVRILEPIPSLADVLPIVLQHHEWFNGAGYPDGVAGEGVSFHARIFAVADVYDALLSDRPYRPGLPWAEVVAYIRDKAGSQFDPRVVDAFLRAVQKQTGRAELAATAEIVSPWLQDAHGPAALAPAKEQP